MCIGLHIILHQYMCVIIYIYIYYTHTSHETRVRMCEVYDYIYINTHMYMYMYALYLSTHVILLETCPSSGPELRCRVILPTDFQCQ